MLIYLLAQLNIKKPQTISSSILFFSFRNVKSIFILSPRGKNEYQYWLSAASRGYKKSQVRIRGFAGIEVG